MDDAALQRVETLLAPVSSEHPAGDDLSYSSLFDQIREARRADDPSLAVGEWVTSVKVAEWGKVLKLSEDALTRKSKDLQLGVWYAEALARVESFRGVQIGLAALAGLLDRFWDSLWPALDPHDLDQRVGKIEWLNAQLGLAIREIALTSPQHGGYCWLLYKSSRDIDNLGLKDADARDRAVAQGALSGEAFDKSAINSGVAFYMALSNDIVEAQQAFTRLELVCDSRFGLAAPNLSDVRGALQACADVAARLLEQCGGAPAAAPLLVVRPAGDVDAATVSATLPVGAVAMPAGPVQTRAQAVQQLREVARYFRTHEPHSPVALLVERAARWVDMPLEDWLRTVIKDDSTMNQLRELLDIRRD